MSAIMSNNGDARLAASLSTSDTTMQLKPGHGARFAAIPSGSWTPLTIVDSAGNFEIVRATEKSGDTFTIVREQEGTTARVFAVDAVVQNRPTAAVYGDLYSRLSSADSAASAAQSAANSAQTAANNAQTSANAAQATANAALPKSGGTMTGDITLKGNATAAMHPVTKQQMEAAISGAGGYAPSWQEFNASGTFTVPSGVTAVYVSGIGGGGGAGGKNTGSYGTGGGGSGQYCIRKKVSVTPGQVITVTIGTGGNGGTISGTNGSNGTATTFGALLTLSGGSGSPGRTDTNTTPGIGGMPNGQTSGHNGTSTVGGAGGCSPFGYGGVGVAGDGGSAAANTGGGGGGTGTTSSKAGGKGGSGYLLVEW